MKVLVEIEGAVKKGDILVYDEDMQAWKATSMQAFCHELFVLNEQTNGRIDRMRNDLIGCYAQISKLSSALKNEGGDE